MVTCLEIHLYKYELAGPGTRLAGAVFLYGWISRKQGRVVDSACCTCPGPDESTYLNRELWVRLCLALLLLLVLDRGKLTPSNVARLMPMRNHLLSAWHQLTSPADLPFGTRKKAQGSWRSG